jgi:hypothetical protein
VRRSAAGWAQAASGARGDQTTYQHQRRGSVVVPAVSLHFRVKHALRVVTLDAQIPDSVAASVAFLQETAHCGRRVTVQRLDAHGRITHCNYPVCDVCKVQIHALPDKAPLLLADKRAHSHCTTFLAAVVAQILRAHGSCVLGLRHGEMHTKRIYCHELRYENKSSINTHSCGHTQSTRPKSG